MGILGSPNGPFWTTSSLVNCFSCPYNKIHNRGSCRGISREIRGKFREVLGLSRSSGEPDWVTSLAPKLSPSPDGNLQWPCRNENDCGLLDVLLLDLRNVPSLPTLGKEGKKGHNAQKHVLACQTLPWELTFFFLFLTSIFNVTSRVLERSVSLSLREALQWDDYVLGDPWCCGWRPRWTQSLDSVSLWKWLPNPASLSRSREHTRNSENYLSCNPSTFKCSGLFWDVLVYGEYLSSSGDWGGGGSQHVMLWLRWPP